MRDASCARKPHNLPPSCSTHTDITLFCNTLLTGIMLAACVWTSKAGLRDLDLGCLQVLACNELRVCTKRVPHR